MEAADLAPVLGGLAAAGVHVGTSSWKYPGWIGQLYSSEPYLWRGKIARSRFERNCLAEYAQVFSSVCVDAAFYRFPHPRFLEGIRSQVPDHFRFSFKVTDEITVRHFSRLPRFGERAGRPNENFLNADLFVDAFLGPLEPMKEQTGLLIFEFSPFYKRDYGHGREFAADLDRFLERLPAGWDYGVEIRNRNFLHPDYFAVLARHGVMHVYNQWQRMPPVGEQRAMEGSETVPGAFGARFLLRPGRKYQEAVDAFSPYDRIREEDPGARSAGAALIAGAARTPSGRRSYLYVNNRLEGNALETIRAMLALAGLLPAAGP